MALIYIVGASGSGKDSLMRYARERLADNPDVLFAHRYITRAPDAGGENHVALSMQEFAARDKAGLFALQWKSHGHAYGIGIEINQWLAKGITVVVNGSREYLAEAARLYPAMLPVRIEVSPEILRDRLQARGRESRAEIDARLARHQSMRQSTYDGIIITNDGPLAEAGEALVAAITQQTNRILCA
jgi:ribose 1,5-bisphosphokinase